MDCAWKPDWEQVKQHHIDWWNHEGLVLAFWGWGPSGGSMPREGVEDPGPASSIEEFFTDVEQRVRRIHYTMACEPLKGDGPPIASSDIGPGSLALFLGSEADFTSGTVWFMPCMEDDAKPERRPPIRFNPQSRWWKITEETLIRLKECAQDKYILGCPDLIENIDILASLRGTGNMLMDMAVRPEWVVEKVEEINQAFFEAYQRVYDIISLPDGSSAFGAFGLWAPGKVAKVQCDACGMFSPRMFRRFVVPALTRQCDWLDYSMFHLDGSQCLCQLDTLLEIESLDAIEWTPDPKVPGCGSPRWYELYRHILDAGKSVQAPGVANDEILPLLDAVGGKGMYITSSVPEPGAAEKLMKQVEPYR